MSHHVISDIRTREVLSAFSGVSLPQEISLFHFETVTSTMDIAKDIALGAIMPKAEVLGVGAGIGPVVVARSDIQEKGRGRENRIWVSPKGVGVYFTLLVIDWPQKVNLSGLSLAIGIAVVRMGKTLGINVSVKWPNDVVVFDEHGFKKLSGVLIEASTQSSRTHVSIGVGLNVLPVQVEGNVNATSLSELGVSSIDADRAFPLLIREILLVLKEFQNVGFSGLREEWLTYSALIGRNVSIGGEVIHCKVIDVNNEGGLVVLNNNDGKVHVIYSGEVNVTRN